MVDLSNVVGDATPDWQAQELDKLRAAQQGAQSQPMPGVAPPEGPGAVLNRLGAAVMAGLHKTFIEPKEAVQTAIAGSPEQFRQMTQSQADQWQPISDQLPDVPPALAAMGPLGLAVAATGGALKHMPDIGPAASDLGSDPWNWVAGIGAGARVGAGALEAGAQGATHFSQALNLVADIMQGIQGAPIKAATMPFVGSDIPAAIKAAIPALEGDSWLAQNARIPGLFNIGDIPGSGFGLKKLEQTVQMEGGIPKPQTNPVPAESFNDFIGTQSRYSIYTMMGRRLMSALQNVTQRGTDLPQEISDLSMAQNGQLVPQYKNAGASLDVAKQLDSGLSELVDKAPTPYARMYGVQVMNQLEQVNAQAIEGILSTATQTLQTAKDAGMIGKDFSRLAGQTWHQAWVDMHNEIMPNILAAQEVVRRVSRMGSDVPNLPDNPIAQRLNGAVNDALEAIDTAKAGGVGEGYGLARPRVTPGVDKLPLAERFNEMQTQAGDLNDITQKLYSRALDIAGPDLAPLMPDAGNAANMLSQRRGELDLMAKQGLPGMLHGLSPEQQGVILKFFPDMAKAMEGITQSRQVLENGVEQLSKQVGVTYQPFNPGYGEGQTIPNASNWLSHLNNSLGEIAKVDPTTAEQLAQGPATHGSDLFTRFLSDKVPDTTRASIDRALKAYPAGDLLGTDPLLLTYAHTMKAYKQALNIPDNPLSNGLVSAINLYKELHALEPDHMVTDVLGGLVQGAMTGANDPIKTSADLAKAVWATVRGQDARPQDIQNFVKIMGKEVPSEATAAASNIPGEWYQSASQTVGPFKMAVLGSLIGAGSGVARNAKDADPSEGFKNALLGAALGGTAGGLAPSASKWFLGKLMRNVQDVMYQGSFLTGAAKDIAENGGMAEQIARDALAQPQNKFVAMPGGGSYPLVNTIAPDVQEKTAQIIGALKGLHSPDFMQQMLESAGVERPVAETAANQWAAVRDAAYQKGADLADRTHFDFTELNNFEQGMRVLSPGSTWALKAIPFFAQHVLENPWIIGGVADLESLSQQEKDQNGLPNRFAGTLQIPGASDIAAKVYSTLTGRDIKAFYNPLRGILPFANIAKAGVNPRDENPMAAVLRMADAVGIPTFSNPILHAPVRMLLNQPAADLIPQAGALQGITSLLGANRGQGIDLNALPNALENAGRGIITRGTGTQAPPDERNQAIMDRLDEMVAEKFGQVPLPNSALRAPYDQAKAEQMGKLWDDAAADTARLRGVHELGGALLGDLNPAQLLNHTEEKMRGAEAPRILDPAVMDRLSKAAVQRPDSPVDPQIVDRIRTAATALAKGTLPPFVEQTLASGTARNVNQVLDWVKQERVNQDPWARGYQQGGNPEQVRLQTLLNAYRNIPMQLAKDPAFKDIPSENLIRIGEMMQERQILGQMAPQALSMADQTSSTQGRMLKYIQALQDDFRKSNPILDEYMAYQSAHSLKAKPVSPHFQPANTGSMDDFINNHWLPDHVIGLRR